VSYIVENLDYAIYIRLQSIIDLAILLIFHQAVRVVLIVMDLKKSFFFDCLR